MQDTDSPFRVSIVAARWGSYRHTGLAYRRLVSTSATQSCCQAVSYLADRPPAGALLLKVPCCSCRLHGQSQTNLPRAYIDTDKNTMGTYRQDIQAYRKTRWQLES